jgi:hypothetical protein
VRGDNVSERNAAIATGRTIDEQSASPNTQSSRPATSSGALVLAVIVATISFWAYTQTLLPGVDLGDTGGFQAAVLWPATSARQAYPLYYALARPFVATLIAANPARGLNLFSAVCGAAAVGVFAWLIAAITDSLLTASAASLLLAFSYTFWSQAIIAEVYTLHLTLVGLCLIALHAFAARPSRARLAIFFAVYALSFGNHLSMVLLLVPFTLFLFRMHPTPRDLLRTPVIVMAIAIAVAGALQYTPNIMAVGSGIDGPQSIGERAGDFWFDVTKADWRETMVLGNSGSETIDRVQMWMWDARQQFGVVGLVLAAIGAVRLGRRSRPWAWLAWTSYAINTVFAFTYNVGDTHVFFLPSHYFTALFAGIAVAPLGRLKAAPTESKEPHERWMQRFVGDAFRRPISWAHVPALLLLLYAGWRAWDTWPAIDRHADHRGEQLVARVAAGVDEHDAVLVSAMDWEMENALLYSARWERQNLAWVRLPEVLLHLPYFVSDNREIGRELVLTDKAAADTIAAYGSLFPIVEDDRVSSPSFSAAVDAIPRGSLYVLSLLTPRRDGGFDATDFDRAVSTLAGGHPATRRSRPYEVWAGIAGEKPLQYLSSARPFRRSFAITGEPFEVRMESWLATDTFRRAGFGHVLHGREHSLIVERGVSLVWWGRSGEPHVVYAAGLYAPRPRFRIPAVIMSLANRDY